MSETLESFLTKIGLQNYKNTFHEFGIDTYEGLLEVDEDSFSIFSLKPVDEKKLKDEIKKIKAKDAFVPLHKWTTKDVEGWIDSLHLESGDLVKEVCRERKIVGMNLFYLQQASLSEFSVAKKEMIKFLAELKKIRASFNPENQSESEFEKCAMLESFNEIVHLDTANLPAITKKNWKWMIGEASSTDSVPVATLVGYTGVGKSHIINEFLPISARLENKGPVVALPGTHQSTTSNIQSFKSAEFAEPGSGIKFVRFLDLEGQGGGIPKTKRIRLNLTIPSEGVGEAKSQVEIERLAQVKKVYPALAYVMSDVIIYIDTVADANRSYLKKPAKFAKLSAVASSSSIPSLIILVNKKHFGYPPGQSPPSPEESTAAWIKEHEQDPELKNIRERFRKVYYMQIPDRSREPELYLQQIASLKNLVRQLLPKPCAEQPEKISTPSTSLSSSQVINLGSNSTDCKSPLAQLAMMVNNIKFNKIAEVVWFRMVKEFTKQWPNLDKSAAYFKVLLPKNESLSAVFASFTAYLSLLNPTDLYDTSARIKAFQLARSLSLNKLAAMTAQNLRIKNIATSAEDPYFIITRDKPHELKQLLQLFLQVCREKSPCCFKYKNRDNEEVPCTQVHNFHMTDGESIHLLADGTTVPGPHRFDEQDSEDELLRQFLKSLKSFITISNDAEFRVEMCRHLDILKAAPSHTNITLSRCIVCVDTKDVPIVLECRHRYCRECVSAIKQDSPCDKSPEGWEKMKCPLCSAPKRYVDQALKIPGLAGFRVLCLDGGGVRGTISNMIMEAICKEAMLLPHEAFDYIIGTSVGAILAGSYGLAHLSFEDISKIFAELPTKVFKNTFFKSTNVFKHVYFWVKGADGHAYEFNPITEVLNKTFGETTFLQYALNLQNPVVEMISATPGEHPHMTPAFFGTNLTTSEFFYDQKAVDGFRASAAAPTYFPPCIIETRRFVDGGIIHNNPADVGLNRATNLWKNHSLDILISVGTGLPTNASLHKKGSFLDVMMEMVEQATETEHTASKLEQLKDENDSYFRFNPQLSAMVPLNTTDPQQLEMLKKSTAKLLENETVAIKKAAGKLRATVYYVESITQSQQTRRAHSVEVTVTIKSRLPQKMPITKDEKFLCEFFTRSPGGKFQKRDEQDGVVYQEEINYTQDSLQLVYTIHPGNYQMRATYRTVPESPLISGNPFNVEVATLAPPPSPANPRSPQVH